MQSDESLPLIIGIDLGTTHSLVAVVDSGFPMVLADEQGDGLFPSVLYRDASRVDGFVVGREAPQAARAEQGIVIASVKRLIGRKYAQLSPEERAFFPFGVRSRPDGGIALQLQDGFEITPEAVSTIILERLKRIASAAMEEEVSRAVITVPAYFSHAQREATKTAAEAAGWVVERMINEPTAAALAYGLGSIDDDQTVAVYDLGGGTFDLSILQMREGVFEVLGTAGDTRLGGDDLDQAITKHLIHRLGWQDVSTWELSRLMSAAREAKEVLSEQDAYVLALQDIRPSAQGEGEIVLRRDEVEEVMRPVIQRTYPIVRRALMEAEGKGMKEVDHLILVGGSTRIPLLRTRLKEWFGLEPDVSQHPDRAVALGAAIQAGILCGRVRQVVLVDVLPLSLGIETFGGLMNVIIPRNSTIPTKAGEMFTNAVDRQSSMVIRVLQGERELAKDNWLLGEIAVPFEPGPKGKARVGVQFSINRDGILEVLARDTATGEDHVLHLDNTAVDVDDEKVESMVNASIEHALEDMNDRIWTEAKLKSEELLPAVSLALDQVGAKLSEEERRAVLEASDRVRAALADERREATALKKANQQLDEATQTLAALLVEAAFEELG